MPILKSNFICSVFRFSRVLIYRGMASEAGAKTQRGLILGIYSKENDNSSYILTPSAQKLDGQWNGNLTKLLARAGLPIRKGKARIFYGIDEKYDSVAVIGLGSQDASLNEVEDLDQRRENVRIAVACGVRNLRDVGARNIDVDPCGDAEAAAEGGTLALHSFDSLKAVKSKKPKVDINLLDESVQLSWKKGVILAEGQNLARRLVETPANLMTPTVFTEEANKLLSGLGVNVIVHDKQWAEEKKMGSFLSVTRGSMEPPKFLELHYLASNESEKPIILVGKGITFDSGGISLKPSKDMDKMRGDMGGAACVLSTIYTLARLGVKVNLIGLTPLTENMPSGTATKPGDVVYAMNGKSIQVDNTDAEGRLVLADALVYAETFNPIAVVDMATLTGAMRVALGAGASGVFTNSKHLWNGLHEAGQITGDRVWRMPLFELYKKQVTESDLADVNNIGSRDGGGACTAAAFLKEFVTIPHWAHIDIAGVMQNSDEVPYLSKVMSGRPTRTLVEFISRLNIGSFS